MKLIAQRFITQLGVLVVGLFISLLLAREVHEMEAESKVRDFQQLVTQLGESIAKEVAVNSELLYSFELLFANANPNRVEFGKEANKILKRHPELFALEWLPRIIHDERETTEFFLDKLIPGRRILAKTSSGDIAPSDIKPEYYPIFYVEPLSSQLHSLGFDLSTVPSAFAAMEKAKVKGKVQLSGPISLIEDKQLQIGISMFYPIFNDVNSDTSNADLRGYISGVFRLKDIVKQATTSGAYDFDFSLYDITGGTTLLALFHSSEPTSSNYKDHFDYQYTLSNIADRQWQVRASITPNNSSMPLNSSALITLVVGLFITTIAVIYAHLIVRRNDAIARQISDKTNELNSALVELQNQKYALDQHAIVAVTDLKGTITYVNEKFCEISGYSKEELLGQNHRMLNSGHHPTKFWREMFETVKKEGTWHGEICNIAKSGQLYWVGTTISSLKDESGRPHSYIAIRTDITGAKQASDILLDYSRQLELILRSTGVGTWDWDLQTGHVAINERWAEIIGYSSKEIAPITVNTWQTYTHPDDFLECQKQLRAHWYGDADSYQTKFRMRHKSGAWVWVLSNGRVVERDADNNPTRMLGTHLDISESEQQSNKLRESLSLVEATLEATNSGILVTDEKGKLLRANKQLYRLWGLKFTDIHQVDDREFMRSLTSQLIDTEQARMRVRALYKTPDIEAKETLQFNDGRVFERVSLPMWIDGEVVGRVWSFTDITESYQIQHELTEAKQLAERASATKSEFLANMSHEIRTPMNGVLGMLNLLKNTNLNEEQSHKLKLATSSAENLLTILNDILDFSKVDAGKLELEQLDFNPSRLLGDLCETMALKANEKRLELILDIRELPLNFVKGDPSRLRQILTNLVGNAIKFTAQGEIVVCAKMHAEGDKWRLICSVSDTGIGISQTSQSRLFSAFTQADASTTRHFGGTGLGLAICKQLCQLMHGDIALSSTEGKGSTFTFNLLLEASEHRPLTLPPLDREKINILIVDDNKTNREVITGQLESWEIRCVAVSSAKEALAALHAALDTIPFTLAILDMQMPGIDGEELGKMIRKEQNFDTLKLVMMTSMGQFGDSQRFADVGFNAYFPKPVTADDLFKAVGLLSTYKQDQSDPPIITKHMIAEIVKPHSSDERQSLNLSTRVLLVEDNMVNQIVASKMLSQLGLTCSIANNGVEALKQLQTEELGYDLILMDCQMPQMDGFETTTAIRAGVAGKDNIDVTIIAMTANAMQGDKKRCIEAGMNDYISKPINVDTLRRTLLNWIPETQP